MKNIDFSPVHLRTKKIAQGKESIYLDIVNDGVRRKEYLGLYLVPELTRADKVINRATMKKAEEIKAKRLLDLLEGKLTFAGEKGAKVNLIEWLEKQRLYYYDSGNMNYSKTIHSLIHHIGQFATKTVTMKDVTHAFHLACSIFVCSAIRLQRYTSLYSLFIITAIIHMKIIVMEGIRR